MKLSIYYENSDIAVLSKPAGIAVHSSLSAPHEPTLIDVLKSQFFSLSTLGGTDRPGIVHRLDKDTSGLLLIAKTDRAYKFLVQKMKEHAVEKYYLALLVGHLTPPTGTIDAPIGRSFQNRKKMTHMNFSGRPSVTHYRVLEYVNDFTFVEARLETGRTHQIRVHFKAIGFPVVGDSEYGRSTLNKKFEQQFGLQRQFLHAYKIRFPLLSGSWKTVEIDLPEDLLMVLKGLKKT